MREIRREIIKMFARGGRVGGGVWAPCPTGIYGACVGAAALPRPSDMLCTHQKNVIARSAATWQSVPFMWCRAGEYGLPHQCAHWFAMTRGFESAVRGGSEVRAPRPTEAGRGGAMRAGRRGNRRSAAGGGRSEPISRKCPDWRPRQWTGIGWHDGGQSPTPTHSGMIFIKCHCEERSDVAIRAPYMVPCGEGVRIATPVCALVRNDTGF